MARKLSERETAVLRVIEKHSPSRDTRAGATGEDIARELSKDTSPPVSAAGAHRTATSLCRKNLAWRAGTNRYRITQTGRDALRGCRAGEFAWVAR